MLKTSRKLSTQLSLGAMLLAAPIFLLSLGILFKQSHNLIYQEVMEYSHSTLNTTLHRVRTYMGTIETAANANAWMLEEHFRPDSLRSVSNRIVRLNHSVVSSSVYAVPDMFKEYGHSFSLYTVRQDDSVTTYCEPDYDYFDKACYTHPVNSGNACWIDPFLDNIEGDVDYNEAIATYCRPLKQQDGRIVGVVTADLSFSRMANMLYEKERPYPNAYYVLLGGDGRYLIHPDTTRMFRKTIFTDADPSKDKDLITLGYEMTAGMQGAIHVKSNGQLYHVSYQSVPGTNWSLALVCPDSDAMKSFYKLGYVIVALIVIGLLVILLLCMRVVKRTVRPVYKLADITKQMSEGQYDEIIPVTSQTGIISDLQNSFAQMQQSLDNRMGSLQHKADDIRKQNETLNKAKLQAEETVRRKNRFIHHMTQQLRTPLNVIMGFAEVLDESSTDKGMINEEDLNSILGMMKNNVIGMNRMVLMMFDAAETDATGKLLCKRLDEVSCNELSRECINHTNSHFPQANIQFETELQDAICILTNHNYLMRILRELLYNAVRYSDEKHIVLHVSQTETTVRFSVQDVGPGLPAYLPELTFKPFTMNSGPTERTGLGLPLAKRHAISLGGSLIIDTDYQEGCRIVVEMPK